MFQVDIEDWDKAKDEDKEDVLKHLKGELSLDTIVVMFGRCHPVPSANSYK